MASNPTSRLHAQKSLSIPKTSQKREFVMISDGELDAPIYAGDDSSDDDERLATRADIRPSSFERKQPATTKITAYKAQAEDKQTAQVCPIWEPNPNHGG